MNIPDYYKQFQSPGPAVEKKEQEKPQVKEQVIKPAPKPGQDKTKQNAAEQDNTFIYQGNGFIINQLQDWKDSTIHTITGPVSDGVQHNLIIVIDRDIPFDYIIDYAEMNIKILERQLKGCTLLQKGITKLKNEMEAYEAYFSWIPADGIKIYHHQIYVLSGKTGYKMTAAFTKKTLYSLGPQVERMMLSFIPTANPTK